MHAARAVDPVHEARSLGVPPSARQRLREGRRQPVAQPAIPLRRTRAPEQVFELREQLERAHRERLRHGLAAVLDDLVLVVDVAPEPAERVDVLFDPGCRALDIRDVPAQPLDVLRAGDVEPDRLEHLDVARDEEHHGVLGAIHRPPAHVVLAVAVRLHGARIAPQPDGVLAHEPQLQLEHPPHDVEVERAAPRDAPLDLELVVDVGVGAGVHPGHRAAHVPDGVGVVGAGRPLDHRGQHRAPVEARGGVGEQVAAGQVEREPTAGDVGVRPCAVAREASGCRVHRHRPPAVIGHRRDRPRRPG